MKQRTGKGKKEAQEKILKQIEARESSIFLN